MMVLQNKNELASTLSGLLKISSEITDIQSAAGGSINSAYRISFGGSKFFLKVNSKDKFPGMFKKEIKGLNELLLCKHLVIPRPVLEFAIGDQQYLLMEYLEKAPSNGSYSEKLGSGLAELHKISAKDFGYSEDNYIGSVLQSNNKKSSWAEFFAGERLSPLVKWVYDGKFLSKKHLDSFERLYRNIPEIFPSEPPSLLHGDLWGGNTMNTTKGPSVYDPAVYYGHREMDLAMTYLFGGFEDGFYEAYHASFPLEKNYRQRIGICNLYPLLVHVRLFGNGYLQDILQTIKRF